MRLLSKSCAAFEFSVEKLQQRYKKLYFWTLTFISVPASDEMAMQSWAKLSARLQHHFCEIKGLRVCELHRSHGIHFHLIVNERIPIGRMKAIAYGTGRLFGRNHYLDFGRMSVTSCDDDIVHYLAKYLTKDYASKHWFGRRRRWGAIGGFDATRMKDVEYDSQALRNRKALFGPARTDYAALIMTTHYTKLWGALEHWPDECRALVWRQQGKNKSEWMRHYHPHNTSCTNPDCCPF